VDRPENHEGLDEWVVVKDVVGDGREGEGNIVATTDDDKSSADVFEHTIRETLKKPEGELTKADLEKLTYLTLHRNRLAELPKSLEELTQLTHLWLNSNQLTNVNGLEKLTQLTSLGLSNNQLTKLPKGLEKLTQLTYLQLAGNKLTEVPKGLEKLTQLTHLYLYRNQLTSVKGLEKLTKLEELNLDYCFDLTKAQINQLQKALPKCRIDSTPLK
jgi:Leucine-rich repeat (LRR) protein